MNKIQNTKNYNNFLIDIKQQIQISQTKAITKVNQELIILYFNVGKSIFNKQQELGWGAKVIDSLSNDIKVAFPQLGGFSVRNIKLMVQFYNEYHEMQIGQPSVAQNKPERNSPELDNEKMPQREAEYSLKNMSQPIGISQYELTEVLPKEFESSLPTIEMIEDELRALEDDSK